DEAVVGDAVGAGGRVDALDPQLPEVTLPPLAVAVVVDEGVGDLLLGLAVQAGAPPPVAAGLLQRRPAVLVGVARPLGACHVSAACRGPRNGHAARKRIGPGRSLRRPCRRGAARGPVTSLAEKLLDPLGVGRSRLRPAGETTGERRRLVL